MMKISSLFAGLAVDGPSLLSSKGRFLGRLQQSDDVTHEASVVARDFVPAIKVLLRVLSLILCLLHESASAKNFVFHLFSVVPDSFNLDVLRLQRFHDFFVLRAHILHGGLLILDLLQYGFKLSRGLFSALLSASCSHFGVFKISLKLVVLMLKLLNLFKFLRFHLPLLLLHVCELVDELGIGLLAHSRVCCGRNRCGTRGCIRSVALVEVVIAGGAARGNCGLETDLNPSAFKFALAQLNTLHLEAVIAEL